MARLSARLPALLTGALLLGLLIFTQAAKDAARESLTLCAGVLLPSLFPFCVGMELFGRLGLADALGKRLATPMRRLFHLPGAAAAALLSGLLGGYPLGAHMTAALCLGGTLTRQEAATLSRFSNNAGPAFVLGAVGGAVFGSARLGALLWAIHAASALLTGMLLRGRGTERRLRTVLEGRTPGSAGSALPEAIEAAAGTMLRVCGTVVFSTVVLALCCRVLPIGRLPDALAALIRGAVELTNGCLALAGLPLHQAFPLAALLLGWGGACVHLQALPALSSAGLPIRPYLRAKLLQALLSYVLAELAVIFL